VVAARRGSMTTGRVRAVTAIISTDGKTPPPE
jgi:hypothetical protein